MVRGQVKSGGMNESMQLAEKVAAQLARHLTDVVLCPGSRNAPLSLALLARDDIRVHTRLDERGGAFTALGMARVQRRHVGVVMTSGTAVANTLPAVVEAHYSHTPLAIISADRPERLVGTGASQTIEQQGIFGVYADHGREAVDLHSRFVFHEVGDGVAFDAGAHGDAAAIGRGAVILELLVALFAHAFTSSGTRSPSSERMPSKRALTFSKDSSKLTGCLLGSDQMGSSPLAAARL